MYAIDPNGMHVGSSNDMCCIDIKTTVNNINITVKLNCHDCVDMNMLYKFFVFVKIPQVRCAFSLQNYNGKTNP